ncbi:MAG: tetraacyldisaccharide 4'-kinase, partial [Chitinophagaceae bacterium]|nr:tetraacyldisaccharide 4'-kinase [Chitinophagaceae bacterium]
IIVTKCSEDLTQLEKESITREIAPAENQKLYFSRIVYGTPVHVYTNEKTELEDKMTVLLICGIANPRPLKDYLNAKALSYDMLRFPDHHIYNSDDLREIKKQFEKLKGEKKIIITTEKDAVRLQKFESELKGLPVYALPIQHRLLFGGETDFRDTVVSFIAGFEKMAQQ